MYYFMYYLQNSFIHDNKIKDFPNELFNLKKLRRL